MDDGEYHAEYMDNYIAHVFLQMYIAQQTQLQV